MCSCRTRSRSPSVASSSSRRARRGSQRACSSRRMPCFSTPLLHQPSLSFSVSPQTSRRITVEADAARAGPPAIRRTNSGAVVDLSQLSPTVLRDFTLQQHSAGVAVGGREWSERRGLPASSPSEAQVGLDGDRDHRAQDAVVVRHALSDSTAPKTSPVTAPHRRPRSPPSPRRFARPPSAGARSSRDRHLVDVKPRRSRGIAEIALVLFSPHASPHASLRRREQARRGH